ncbi:MAG: beta-propeller fold lactonase family protein [Betaproteobacteria bacterium]
MVATATSSALTGAQATAATYVYVSNAGDGDIGMYTMQADGSLQPGLRVKAQELVMPMVVSPDRKFLFAAARSKPFSVHTFAIDSGSGALKSVSVSPLADSFPYISLDKTGRFLLGASYSGSVISVNAVGTDGKVDAKPLQVLSIGRNAHSIRVDESNSYVFVPSLGSDQLFQFTFDAKTGRLVSNTPAVVLMKSVTGPRHFITSPDNKFVYLLSEMAGTVTTFSLDAKTGLLTEVASISGLPADTKLRAGALRGAVGAPGGPPPRNTDNDIWAADINMTPNGKFLYISERSGSSINALSVDGATGKLTYVGSTPTEKQPRGFRIDSKGKYMVVTGEKSDMIATYAIDPANGSLKQIGRYPTGKGANWVEIVSND